MAPDTAYKPQWFLRAQYSSNQEPTGKGESWWSEINYMGYTTQVSIQYNGVALLA